MKIYSRKNLIFLLILVVLAVLPHSTHAISLTSFGDFAKDAALSVPALLVAYIVMPLMSLLVWVSAMILNWSVDYSVVNMAKHVTEAGIDGTWSVVRDVANMGFIFVLIYTALQTIFGYGDYKTVIKNVVIAALLINFSLFFTKAIIDASNVLAMFFYRAISPEGTSTHMGIASSFTDILGLQSLYKVAGFDPTKLVTVGIAGTVIYLVASFSFLAIAALFILRFVLLLLIMVLSPIYAVGSIIPGLKPKAGQWKDTLLSQSFFAPIYFMLTWVTLKIAKGLTDPIKHKSLLDAFVGSETAGVAKANGSSVEVIINFGIIIALLITSLIAAKKMADASGGAVSKKLSGWAGGATMGIAGRAGRGTFGRAGAALANSQFVKDGIDRGGIYGATARLTKMSGTKAAKSSFDLRATDMGKSLGGGSVKKGTSFETDVKDRNKRVLEDMKFLGYDKTGALKKKEKEAEKELEKARKDAEKPAMDTHKDVVESVELKAALAREKAAEENMKNTSNRPADVDPVTFRENKEKEYKDAREKADVLRAEHKAAQDAVEQARKEFIDKQTEKEAKAKTEAEQARKKVEEKSEAFINKQAGPTVSLPDWVKKKIEEKLPEGAKKGERGAIYELSSEGIGGSTADRWRKATRFKGLHNALADVVELRRNERDARVKAIRKELNKTDEEKKEEKLEKLLADATKKEEKTDEKPKPDAK